MKLDEDNNPIEENTEEYLRSIIGFMQIASKAGVLITLTEDKTNIALSYNKNGVEIKHTTSKQNFVKANKKGILNLLTNGSKENE